MENKIQKALGTPCRIYYNEANKSQKGSDNEIQRQKIYAEGCVYTITEERS